MSTGRSCLTVVYVCSCRYILLYIAYIAVFIIFGSAVNLQYFRKTNYGERRSTGLRMLPDMHPHSVTGAIIIVFITWVAFPRSPAGIQIIFYFLHGQCMIAFAFMLSSLFSSSLVAVVFAYLYVFASGLIGSLLLQVRLTLSTLPPHHHGLCCRHSCPIRLFPKASLAHTYNVMSYIPHISNLLPLLLLLQTFMNNNPIWIFFVEWVPAWSLYRGLYEMGAYTFLGVYRDQPGMQFNNLKDPGNGMVTCWAIFIVEWAIFMVLGWYFEQVGGWVGGVMAVGLC